MPTDGTLVFLAGTRIKFGGGVVVDEESIIRITPPFLKKFMGQPLKNAEKWLGCTGVPLADR